MKYSSRTGDPGGPVGPGIPLNPGGPCRHKTQRLALCFLSCIYYAHTAVSICAITTEVIWLDVLSFKQMQLLFHALIILEDIAL